METLFFEDAGGWERWLEDQHATTDGVWLRFAKKGSGIASLTYGPALEVALCFGWIDGQSRGESDTHYLQRFTPRRKRSIWSKRNRTLVEELAASGRMRPAGLAEVERAKADGRWDAAYDGPATATVPDDLAQALDARPGARAFFEALDAQNRYAILHRVQTASKPQTRARRVQKFADMCAAGERIYS
ncbi:MAG: YdeI/OmpD-associated family protein [Solirubrobacterales bacterium]